MLIREPVVAGRFYPSQPDRCRAELAACLPQHVPELPADVQILGGIVPHAGWICSGAVAAQVIAALAQSRALRTVVIFGAVHVPHGPRAAVFTSGAWETPLGTVSIDDRLAGRIAESSSLVEADPHAHEDEHSIEVQVPFIQHYLPKVKIVPIMVPPSEKSHTVGQIVGRVCAESAADVAFLGSTDLTHYGPSYDFEPHGGGMAGLNWARNENDRRMIDLILGLKDDAVVAEARTRQNACGSGAIAATIAACRQAGATRATLLRHTTSYEVLRARFNEPPTDAVGYAGVVFS